jgi:hypothetical protein
MRKTALIFAFLLLCPGIAGAVDSSLLRTGQTDIYQAGDDGDVKNGIAWPSPRFVDNGNGTITDKLTGLVWLKKANCGGMKNWGDAIAFAKSLHDGWTGDRDGGDCGLADGSLAGTWRLPNVNELRSLIDYSQSHPPIQEGHPFQAVQLYGYWTSTSYPQKNNDVRAGNLPVAWHITMDIGNVLTYFKNSYYYIWPVREDK